MAIMMSISGLATAAIWFLMMPPVCVSAGVGRTGTFIALDRLMQHIREHEYVDILGMVSEMRSHRLSMVQTEVRHWHITPTHTCVNKTVT